MKVILFAILYLLEEQDSFQLMTFPNSELKSLVYFHKSCLTLLACASLISLLGKPVWWKGITTLHFSNKTAYFPQLKNELNNISKEIRRPKAVIQKPHETFRNWLTVFPLFALSFLSPILYSKLVIYFRGNKLEWFNSFLIISVVITVQSDIYIVRAKGSYTVFLKSIHTIRSLSHKFGLMMNLPVLTCKSYTSYIITTTGWL